MTSLCPSTSRQSRPFRSHTSLVLIVALVLLFVLCMSQAGDAQKTKLKQTKKHHSSSSDSDIEVKDAGGNADHRNNQNSQNQKAKSPFTQEQLQKMAAEAAANGGKLGGRPPLGEKKPKPEKKAGPEDDYSHQGWEEWGEDDPDLLMQKKNKRFKTKMDPKLKGGFPGMTGSNTMFFVAIKQGKFQTTKEAEDYSRIISQGLKNAHGKAQVYTLSEKEYIIIVESTAEILPTVRFLLLTFDVLEKVTVDNNAYTADMFQKDSSDDEL